MELGDYPYRHRPFEPDPELEPESYEYRVAEIESMRRNVNESQTAEPHRVLMRTLNSATNLRAVAMVGGSS